MLESLFKQNAKPLILQHFMLELVPLSLRSLNMSSCNEHIRFLTVRSCKTQCFVIFYMQNDLVLKDNKISSGYSHNSEMRQLYWTSAIEHVFVVHAFPQLTSHLFN